MSNSDTAAAPLDTDAIERYTQSALKRAGRRPAADRADHEQIARDIFERFALPIFDDEVLGVVNNTPTGTTIIVPLGDDLTLVIGVRVPSAATNRGTIKVQVYVERDDSNRPADTVPVTEYSQTGLGHAFTALGVSA